MNFQSYFLWFVVLVLSLSSCVIAGDPTPVVRKCLAQCIDYCKNESESGIPLNLCDNACLTMCYSARRDIGHADME